MKNIYKLFNIISLISIVGVVVLSIVLDNDSLNVFTFISVKTAEIGTLLLYLMLMAKSIYFIMRKLSVDKDNWLLEFLHQNTKYQRYQGLIVFNILFIHSYVEVIKYIFNFNILVYNFLTVLIPTIILIYMEFTSFSPFQKMYCKWKKSHTVIWLTLPFILLHIIILSDSFLKYLIFTFILFGLSMVEVLVGIEKGYRHVIYIMVGFVLAVVQLKPLKDYEHNILLVASTDQETVADAEEEYEYKYTKENIEAEANATDENTTSDDTTVAAASEDTTVDTEIEDDTSSSEVSTNVYQDGTFTGQGYGHKGSIVVETTIKNDDITSVEVVSENEDAPWWEPVVNTIPAEIVENDSTEGISYVAGSTHSSRGLIEAVNNSLENAKY